MATPPAPSSSSSTPAPRDWGPARAVRRVGDLLVALGLRRRREADGTLAPRAWGRLGILAGLGVLAYLLATTVQVVAPGTVGVPVTFGHVGEELQPGLHLTVPTTRIHALSTRTEQYTMSAAKGEGDRASVDDSVDVLGRDGAAGRVDSTVLYAVDAARAVDVYVGVGEQYLLQVVRPSARTCIRSEFTDYAMVDAVTSSWHDLEDEVATCMADKLDPYGLRLVDFQLREVHLADQVQGAIDAKVAAQQVAERQVFELSKAQQAAEITRVEALATADGQQILACGGEVRDVESGDTTSQVIVPLPSERCAQAQLTPQYLQYFYIQALKELVDSPNNSTIILPMDQELTPMLNIGGTGTPGQVTGPAGAAPTTSTTVPPSAGRGRG